MDGRRTPKVTALSILRTDADAGRRADDAASRRRTTPGRGCQGWALTRRPRSFRRPTASQRALSVTPSAKAPASHGSQRNREPSLCRRGGARTEVTSTLPALDERQQQGDDQARRATCEDAAAGRSRRAAPTCAPVTATSSRIWSAQLQAFADQEGQRHDDAPFFRIALRSSSRSFSVRCLSSMRCTISGFADPPNTRSTKSLTMARITILRLFAGV